MFSFFVTFSHHRLELKKKLHSESLYHKDSSTSRPLNKLFGGVRCVAITSFFPSLSKAIFKTAELPVLNNNFDLIAI